MTTYFGQPVESINPRHRTHVLDRSANNRWRGYCSCGYRTLTYATRSAAQYMADEHATTADHNSR